jgi:hypothetical protein
MKTKLWLSVALALFLSAPAGRASTYSQEMNAQIGQADKGYFVQKYGPPDKQAILDQRTEVWEFRLNEQKFTSPTGYRFATFDRLRLTFTDGKLSSWSRKSVTE